MDIKERKIFSLNNFRGLDKENKLLKVESFRATDGYNFMLDSLTLKTRPSFEHIFSESDKLSPTQFAFESGEILIDKFLYHEVHIYITNKHIRFQSGSLYLNETSSNSSFYHRTFSPFDFTGKRPIFQEEKDCLFIFGLSDGIFVFSFFRNPTTNAISHYVLYELDNKPLNPFVESDTHYQDFEDLPIPYEPTLMIGDNSFEDVNLLSKSSKYRLFANSSSKNDSGQAVYHLPTHFDDKIHKSWTLSRISFYGDKYASGFVFPVYLGKLNEDFTSTITYGDLLNDSTPFEVMETFYPLQDFEYYGNPPTSTISELLRLSKSNFFEFHEKNTGQNVFDFLMKYGTLNGSSWVTNKVVKFTVAVQYKAIYRDPTTNFIIKAELVKSFVSIYVQLRKYENIVLSQTNEQVYVSNRVSTFVYTDPYPDYPTVSGTYTYTYNLSSAPILKKDFSTWDMMQLCKTYLQQYSETLLHGDTVKINAQFYEVKEQIERYLNLHEFYPSEPVPDTMPPFRTDYQNPNNYPVIDTSGIILTTGEIIDWDDDVLRQDIYNKINETIDSALPSSQTGYAFAKIRVYTRYGNNLEAGASLIVKFFYQKGTQSDWQERQSMVYTATISKTSSASQDSLYTFDFDADQHAFVLKTKDYFYDYNGEPSIEIKVDFEVNSDYKLVTKNTFGINFGSENRLFLAGHPDFPNIDRFNISNNLLGDGVKNQSYELTYFPSKNFRVLGSRGAINGYVVATDNQLYITKSENRNDERLFVRERVVDDNGIVGYKEYKTSIKKTPLNNRCLIRFYNDILMLTKDGLYAIELSSNVLTNERLLKMRSGFINSHLSSLINATQNQDLFMFDNDNYLYIFVDEHLFVADSRYVATNENNPIENVSYEIMEWQIPMTIQTAFVENNQVRFIDYHNGIYYLSRKDYDTHAVELFDTISSTYTGIISLPTTDFESDGLNNAFAFEKIYQRISVITTDYTIIGDTVTVLNSDAFVGVTDGTILYFSVQGEYQYFFHPFTVQGFEASGRLTFTFDTNVLGDRNKMFIDKSEQLLYVASIDTVNHRATLTATKGNEVGDVFYMNAFQHVVRYVPQTINLLWKSAILDFGNNVLEKTMFNTSIYATRQSVGNTIMIGYKTMRRIKELDDGTLLNIGNSINVSNAFNFESLDFSTFAMNTFNEFGSSFPTKENNFLYIQFLVTGIGQIELNSINILYKNNRMLKSAG